MLKTQLDLEYQGTKIGEITFRFGTPESEFRSSQVPKFPSSEAPRFRTSELENLKFRELGNFGTWELWNLGTSELGNSLSGVPLGSVHPLGHGIPLNINTCIIIFLNLLEQNNELFYLV